MTLSCYVIDDELHAVEVLKTYIARTPGLALAGYSTDPLQALPAIATRNPPDITFIDVDMPQLNGLDLAGLVNTQTAVVFTTAYREYALEAFEKNAADYLLKPIFYERFLAAVQRVRLQRAASREPGAFFVKTGTRGKMMRVNPADIRYIEGADAYIRIHLQCEILMTYMTLSEVSGHLSAALFSRIHKSYIVRDDLVRIAEPGQVKLADGTCLPVGQAYKAAFQQKLQTGL